LLREGALLVRGPQDVLDGVFGVGARTVAAQVRASLNEQQRAVLEEIASGADTITALSRAGVAGRELLTVLATLELMGCVRRAAGGRYVVRA
jgi:predicted Rossmann fold nucleotide-binding protein DprA/Smf involved in DNA uptake